MRGTPFYYNQYGTHIVDAADIANGTIFFPATPVPEAISNANYFYVWGYNMAAYSATPQARFFEPERYVMSTGLIDGINFESSQLTSPVQFAGPGRDFNSYYRMKLIEGTSFLYQVGIVITGSGVVAGNNVIFSNTLIVSYDTPEGDQPAPGQKKDWQIQPGQKNPLQGKPGRFQFK